ncbi:hypothetical protein [Deinococcus sp. 12RED42]|uniref:hypothetical protein n=1 Tax=Deinococcus sp. 12RED42 TaxID=2745872 RepID=UPI001E45FD0D|nr:hypothetical protein [Deinococcus sp. 12RED42]MCD0164427.1 hypothetical protein [Deinococcus sp. 12RED42]
MITVKRMPQTIRLDGRTYGPSETPIDVPEELARTLGLTPTEGAVLLDASEDELTEALSEAQDSARRYQNRLVGIEQLLRPAQQGESSPEEVIGRLLREIEEARAEPSLFEKTVTEEARRLLGPLRQGEETLTQVLARVVQERRDLGAKVREAQHATEQWAATTEELSVAQAELSALNAELTALRAQTLLPADALKRVTDVSGVGEKLAPKILDALTRPPEG